MTAILILVGIVVLVIAAIVLVAVPVRQAEAAAIRFSWERVLRIGTPVWVAGKSKRKPSGEVRNLQLRNADNPENRHYTFEKRVWQKMRSVRASGRSQAGVDWPQPTLRVGEEIRTRQESYRVFFASDDGRSYHAKMRYARWAALTEGKEYRLGRNTFGVVRVVTPARQAVGSGARK